MAYKLGWRLSRSWSFYKYYKTEDTLVAVEAGGMDRPFPARSGTRPEARLLHSVGHPDRVRPHPQPERPPDSTMPELTDQPTFVAEGDQQRRRQVALSIAGNPGSCRLGCLRHR